MGRYDDRGIRNLICGLVLGACVAAPAAAQRGVDLLNADDLLRLDAPAAEQPVLVAVTSTDRERGAGPGSARPEVVINETHGRRTYTYDDNDFERFSRPTTGEREVAQRFSLPRSGKLVNVSVCFQRAATDRTQEVFFELVFYADNNGRPGAKGGLRYEWRAGISRQDTVRCLTFAGLMAGRTMTQGAHWVGIRFPSSTNKLIAEDRYTASDPAPANDRHATSVRLRNFSATTTTAAWTNPQSSTTGGLKAYGIRMVVDHDPHPDDGGDGGGDGGGGDGDGDGDGDGGGGDPDPDPGVITPPPTGPGYTACRPTVAPLVFEGNIKISLCYETRDGVRGNAKGGLYKSDNSGLLWFFDQNNAEVLVKVLDGCSINQSRWIYVAPLTDVAFNLYVNDGRNPTWSYHNPLGTAAAVKSDLGALRCSSN